MDLQLPLHTARAPIPADRFDPWATEIATMNHSARNIAVAVDGLGSLIVAGLRAIGAAVQSLRKACPVEIEPVQVARPVHTARAAEQTDIRAAA